ncbi:MAG: hypothetical protein ACRCZB_00595 [Bacteroidales bacterium]
MNANLQTFLIICPDENAALHQPLQLVPGLKLFRIRNPGLPNGNCSASSAIKVTFEKWEERILVKSLKRMLLN